MRKYRGIAVSLLYLSRDEGKQTALKTAQEWQRSLEAMMECATNEQRKALAPFLRLVNGAIDNILD